MHIPPVVGVGTVSLYLSVDFAQAPNEPSCRQVLAKALMRELKGFLSVAPLTVLTEIEGCKQSANTCGCSFLEYVEQTMESSADTMFLNLPYRRRAPIAVPCCETNLFQHSNKPLVSHGFDGHVWPSSVAPIVDREEHILIDAVQANRVREIHFFSPVANSDKVVEQRLRSQIGQIIPS